MTGAQRRFDKTMSKILGGTVLTFAMFLGFVNPSWALQVSPSALTFSATSGGTDPSPQTVVLSSNRSRERTWTATENAPWITITPSSGTIATETDTVSVRATVAGLAAGSYSANVTITETSQSGTYQKNDPPGDAVDHRSRCGTGDSTQREQPHLLRHSWWRQPCAQTLVISNTGGGTLPGRPAITRPG